MRVQWNHSDLSGWGGEWAVTREMGVGQLSKVEEPVDRHWTVNVVDTSICRNCGDEHAR
jgi:hypothetical protein